MKKGSLMERIKKTVTIPKDLGEWAETTVNRGEYPGIRSLSGFIEYLIRNEKERKKVK